MINYLYFKLALLVVASVLLLGGCTPSKKADLSPSASAPAQLNASMPAVNEENCRPENIAKVADSLRDQFVSACLRRGSFKKSAGKTW